MMRRYVWIGILLSAAVPAGARPRPFHEAPAWMARPFDDMAFHECLTRLADVHRSVEGRFLALDRIYSQRGGLSPRQARRFLGEALRLAQDPDTPSHLAASALSASAGMLLLLREGGGTGPAEAVGVDAFLLRTAGEARAGAPLRAAAVRALGILRVPGAVEVLESILESPPPALPAEVTRGACLALYRLEGTAAFGPIRDVFERTRNVSVFDTAASCLGRMGTMDALSVLAKGLRRFPDSGAAGFALQAMEAEIGRVLRDSFDPGALLPAIEATRYCAPGGDVIRWIPSLEGIAVAGPAAARIPAAERILEIARSLPLETEQAVIRDLIPMVSRQAGGTRWESLLHQVQQRGHAALLKAVPRVPSPGPVSSSDRTVGNLERQEYGDPVYRILGATGIPGLPNYNHTGVFYGMNAQDGARVAHAPGLFEKTTEADFFAEYKSHGTDYYGAYTLAGLDLPFTGRRAVCQSAWEIVAAAIDYTFFDALDWTGTQFDGTVGDIDLIRCDGVVEYCYERNGFKTWWNTQATPAEWNISAWPDVKHHNDMPDFSVDPDFELSPWAQRGAPPVTGPGYTGPDPHNTLLTRPSYARLPGYEVSTVPGAGYVDVTVKAFDASGVHKLVVILPGEVTPQVKINVQHPVVNSLAGTFHVTQAGTLKFKAMDNGGNEPAGFLEVFIEL